MLLTVGHLLVQIPNIGHTQLPSLSSQDQDSFVFQLLFILRSRATHRVTVPGVPQASGPSIMLLSGVALLVNMELEGGATWGGPDNLSTCLPLSNHEHKGLMLDFCKKKGKNQNKWRL